MEVLPLDGSAFPALIESARNGKLIALVADRDLSRSGIKVSFFGGTARMPAGPALVALRTHSPLVTAFVSYTETGIHIQLEEVEIPLDGDEENKVKVIVQRCADHFADGISQHSVDWHMMQRIWIDDDFVEKK
jgi:KDO2-lipid IV(A) lauroyltransferase